MSGDRYRFKAFGSIDASAADSEISGVECDGMEWKMEGLVEADDAENAFALVYDQISEYGLEFEAHGVDLSDPLPKARS